MSYNKNKTLCFCFDVTYGELEKKIKEENIKTLDEVFKKTSVGLACGVCIDDIKMVLDSMIY